MKKEDFWRKVLTFSLTYDMHFNSWPKAHFTSH
nr:MAG TPA: hypothetical protein [Caudoviricetes sp.]